MKANLFLLFAIGLFVTVMSQLTPAERMQTFVLSVFAIAFVLGLMVFAINWKDLLK